MTTPAKPLQPPPLLLESSFFQHLEVIAEKTPAPEGMQRSYQMGFRAGLAANQADPLQYRVDIGVTGFAAENAWAPYRFQIDVVGFFRLPEERTDTQKLLLLTGAAMLYGSAREMLTLVTGRYIWGPYVLPTVSPIVFLHAAEQQKVIVQNK
jgi:Preprotein translocase subunit SecB